MTEIRYVEGDATSPSGNDPRIIVHVCNDIGAWGAGFVLAISRRWKEPEARYQAWNQGEDSLPFELGQVQFVPVDEDLWVANLIGQRGIRRSGGKLPIRYEAVREGLKRVAEHAKDLSASVHMPRIGCGLAGGNWEEIGAIVQVELADRGIPVSVYDLPGKK